MTTKARQTHPAGKRRAAMVDPWAFDREAAATERWRRHFWQAATVVIFGFGLILWAYGLALIWSVVR